MDETNDSNSLQIESIEKYVNSIDSDYKAEFYAAGLIEQGLSSESVHIVRAGGERRGFSKDISEVTISYSELDHRDYVRIKTNKDGIYDILPEGIFHQLKQKQLQRGKDEIVKDIRIKRFEELQARKFFRPFESEIDKTLIEACLYELKYDKRISNPNFIDIFLPYWDILSLLSAEQATLLMQAIPLIHTIRNDFAEVGNIISLILNVPISIKKIRLPMEKTGLSFESRFGEARLGIDFVLGSTFDDGQYDIVLTIGPIESDRVNYFYEPQNGDRILDFLCRILLPAETFIVKEFNVLSTGSPFTLSGERDPSLLGINTFI